MNHPACLSRRTFLAGSAVLAATAGLGLLGCSTAGTDTAAPNAVSNEDEPVNAYYENAVIYTVDGQDRMAEALAVRDGKIAFVGSSSDGQRYKDTAQNVVDLQGRFVLPGLIEGHIHSGSPDFFDFSLIGLPTADDELAAIKKYVDAHPEKDTYLGFGYMASLYPGEELERGPKKERLDEISPDKPLLVYSFDGHGAWLNSKAFEYLGITPDTPSTPGGEIYKNEDGSLWGTLADSAMSMTSKYPVNQENVADGLATFLQGLNALGYTSIFTPPGNGFFPVPYEGYQTLADRDGLTMRVRGAGIVTSWQTDEDLTKLEELKKKYDSDALKVIAGKIFVDGVMDNESALLSEPYADNPSNYGETGWEQDPLNQAAAAINRAGMLAHIHAIGDEAVTMGLDAIEYAEQNVPDDDERNAITHLQLVKEDDVPRFAELEVTAVADPYWHFKEPQYWESKESPALGERAEKMYPMKSFVDAGVTLVSASDFPVTSNPNPFYAVQFGVTRNLVDGKPYDVPDITDMDDPAYLLWPEERVDIKRMIRSFTADAAWALSLDGETGSLEEGKAADFIVVDQNVLEAKPLDIKNTKVLATYLRGEKVFDAEEAAKQQS